MNSEITVIATIEGGTDTSITGNGMPVASGTASDTISLNVGSSEIIIEVTAQNGTNANTYTVDDYRAMGLPFTCQTLVYATDDDGD